VLTTDHIGATEDYADVLAEMRAQLTALDGWQGEHFDGGGCEFEVAVVWRCETCGREQRHVIRAAAPVRQPARLPVRSPVQPLRPAA
jgi:hypothetical protein